MKVRLKKDEIHSIKETVAHFDENAQVILFGSRVDLNKKGGDIDLLILSKKLSQKDKFDIKLKLYDVLGEQKIDLIISRDGSESAFVESCLKEGVKL